MWREVLPGFKVASTNPGTVWNVFAGWGGWSIEV